MRVNPEKKEEKERVTHALLRATLRLAAAHGFVSLGLREVSRAADIAPTSFYRHFADMEELGLALIEDVAGKLLLDLVARAEQSPPGRRVEAIATEILSSALADPELMRFIVSERVGAIPTFRVALGRQVSAIGTAVQRALDAERGADELPEALASAAMVLILEGANQLLDSGAQREAQVRGALLDQLSALFSGADGRAR